MSLDEYNQRYDEANPDSGGNVNDVPDGKYELSIDKIEYETDLKHGKDFINAYFSIVSGDFKGADARASWMFSDRPSVEYTINDYKAFMRECGHISLHPSDMERQDVRRLFNGIVLSAKLVTSDKGGKSYKNWRYWKFISAPERAATVDLDAPVDVPTTPAPPQPKDQQDIDLDVDPFKEEF